MTLIALCFIQKGCIACEEQAPVNSEVSKLLGVTIEEIDIADRPDAICTYTLRVTPTTVVVKDGIAVETIPGVVQREQFEEILNRHLTG